MDLAQALCDLRLQSDPNLIAGLEGCEDAGVYKLTNDIALVQTVDFFTPIVDDPYTFGQIAVTNALSDVYAMGARPLTAMNIVCFPVKKMNMSILNRILAGGLDKMHEAEVVLVGGHSIDDPELKYGLSVTGLVHPDKVVFNRGCVPGDRLILTKPLGTGLISTAIKGGVAAETAVAKAVASMTALNKKAAELMLEVGINACTDVTGFGLLGHACEMIEGEEAAIIIESSAVPYFPEAREMADMGLVPGGTSRNRDYRKGMVDFKPDLPQYVSDLLFDPQTSGGLLISLPAGRAGELLDRLHQEGIVDAAIIGRVEAGPAGRIQVV